MKRGPAPHLTRRDALRRLATLPFAVPLAGCTSRNLTRNADRPTVPGVVINHIAASTGQYIGSPSIAVLPSGDYVASHDIFGPGSSSSIQLIFCSTDRGQTWHNRAEFHGHWSNLFVHRGVLYLMGTSREYGYAVIRRSTDSGWTWTNPDTSHTGILLNNARYHTAPVPVVADNGRLWRAMEDAMGPGGWGTHFRSFMMSAHQDADLLDAQNWTSTNRVPGDTRWLGDRFGGWLEGNAVVTPDGTIVNILRVDLPAGGDTEKAAVITISDDGAHATFDPQTGFVDFPGGAKKFTIRYDPGSSRYWSLSNPVLEQFRWSKPSRIRNTLALVSSSDLHHWSVHAILLHHLDPLNHAFQYPDWQFDGDDLIAVCRTAYDDGIGGAHNFHDANFLTFHRFPNFRSLSASLVGEESKTRKPALQT